MILPKETVILYGSSISMWTPSDIPTGSQIRNTLLDFLFKDYFEECDSSVLRDWLNWIPFETINEFAPHSINLNAFYAKHLNITRPNKLHKQLAQLAISNKIAALITTNYDCGVEIAAGNDSPIYTVIEPDEFTSSNGIPLFKIHGCTKRPSSLIYRLGQEAKLQDNKAKYLLSLLKNRTLIVIGYSGVDFEICPIIASSQAKKVIWCYKTGNSPKDYETPGYQLISHRIWTELLPIELSMGIPWMQNQTKLELNDSLVHNFKSELYALVKESDRDIWALRLSCAIGYPNLAKKVSKKLLASSMSDDIKTECEAQQGFMFFQSGYYCDAAKAFYYNSKKKKHEHYIISLLDAFDAWRTGGYYLRAMLLFFKAKLMGFYITTPKIKCRIALKETLILRNCYIALYYYKLTYMPSFLKSFIMKILEIFILKLIKNARLYSNLSGLVFDQKQLDELENIFKSSLHEQTFLTDGYLHIGYLSASTTLFRTRSLLSYPLSQDVEHEALERYDLMCVLGNHPEAWKIAIRMMSVGSREKHKEWKKNAKKHLKECQYTQRHRNNLMKWVYNGASIKK